MPDVMTVVVLGGVWTLLLLLVVATLVAAIVIYRHRSNLVRLVQGRENRFYETNTGPEQEDELRKTVERHQWRQRSTSPL